MNQLFSRIRNARRRAGLSQAVLAAKLGVNRSSVAQWEQAAGSSPTAPHLCEMAIVTGVLFEWLATGRGRVVAEAARGDEQVFELSFYAHDEVEERILMGLRKMEYWQTVSILQLVESLAAGRVDLSTAVTSGSANRVGPGDHGTKTAIGASARQRAGFR